MTISKLLGATMVAGALATGGAAAGIAGAAAAPSTQGATSTGSTDRGEHAVHLGGEHELEHRLAIDEHDHAEPEIGLHERAPVPEHGLWLERQLELRLELPGSACGRGERAVGATPSSEPKALRGGVARGSVPCPLRPRRGRMARSSMSFAGALAGSAVECKELRVPTLATCVHRAEER